MTQQNNQQRQSALNKRKSTSTITEIVFIAVNAIGRLFGKGGKTLQRIQQKHPLINIKVGQQATKDSFRKVTLTTNKSSWFVESHGRDACKAAADDCVKACKPRRRNYASKASKDGKVKRKTTTKGRSSRKNGGRAKIKPHAKKAVAVVVRPKPTQVVQQSRRFHLKAADFPSLNGSTDLQLTDKQADHVQVADCTVTNLLSKFQTRQQQRKVPTSGA
mgnify:CR=1 FL=1